MNSYLHFFVKLEVVVHRLYVHKSQNWLSNTYETNRKQLRLAKAV